MDIIRNMVVCDRGVARQFRKGPVPADLGPGTLDRLRRAGAIPAEAIGFGTFDDADVAAVDAATEQAMAKLPKGKTR